MADEVTMARHDLEAKIVKLCWENEAFRKEFTSDPAGTFKKYVDIPAGRIPKIVVHEEAPGTWHIVLPAKPPNAGELTDDELEQVAGGATPLSFASIVVLTITLKVASVSAVASAGITASASITSKKGW